LLRERTDMLLAGDVGGTKTTLALFARENGLQPRSEATFQSDDYDSLEAVVQAFLDRVGVSVERAIFGVAGPVLRGEAHVTNLPWVIREAALVESCGLPAVKLLNDLQAMAYGVLELSADDLYSLNDAPSRDSTKAVIAPGTGLGEAVLFYQNSDYHVLPSEGGHVDFAPTNLFELELLRWLMGRFGHISYERVCSGRGIPNIYAYLKANHFADELPQVAEALRTAEDPTPIIVQHAMAGTCELSIATLNTFVSVLGSEAGNLALKVMATGGIYVGGGIPPKILPKLKDGTFLAAFVNKGRFADMLARIPVYVILNERTALLGAAAFGRRLMADA
jgi:glucokinase